MPDYEQTLRFYEDFKPHLESQLDDDQYMEFIGLCISDYFRTKVFNISVFTRLMAGFETWALCASFQPSNRGSDEKIQIIAHRLMDICKKFLTHEEAEKAILECFLRAAGETNELIPEVQNFLDQDFDV